MTREERITKLNHFITCLKCEVSGKECDDNCPVQYESGNMGEIIENLEAISKALEQEPCEDEYIKVPKKALKYRTAGMVAYNAEWLKNHFDIERAVICGEQEPCEDWYDVPSDEMTLEQARQAVKDLRKKLAEHLEQDPCDVFDKYGNYKYPNDVELTEPNTATSMPCEDAISRKNITAFLNGLISDDTERKKALKYVNELPPVNPQYIEDEIQKMQDLEHAEIDKAYELGKAEGQKSEDAISRSDMLDAIGHGITYTSEELQNIIKTLPPVNAQPNKEDIYREREQAYMCGYEDGSRKYRTEQSEDAISRQAAIDALDKRFDSIPMEQTTEILLLRKDLRGLPPIYPEPISSEKPNTWTPASERLPEFSIEVLTCSNGGFIEIQSREKSYGGYWENQRGDLSDLDEIIAWMPLPKLYEPQERKEQG